MSRRLVEAAPEAPDRPAVEADARAPLLDLLFLALVVFLPAVLYLPNLGFYSDDWDHLQALGAAPGATSQSLLELIRRLIPVTELRPAHAVYLAVQYALFGVVPLGYHLFNHLVLWLGLAMLVVVLRRLGVPRAMALTAATLFGLMPSYSVLRFWMAADMINLSLLMYLISLWADLRSPLAFGRAVVWRVLSVAAALNSVLLYELCMPLLLLNPFVGWWYRHGRPSVAAFKRPETRPLPDARLVVDLAVNLAIVLAATAYKVLASPRVAADDGLSTLGRVLRLARGVLNHHGLVFGLGEPLSIWTILTRYFDPWGLLLAVLAGVGVAAYLYVAYGGSSSEESPATARGAQQRSWAVVVGGLVVLAGGYAIFLTNDQFHFSAAGTYTRIAQVGSLGVALAMAGALGLLGAWIPRPDSRRLMICSLVGLYCGAGVLILNTVANFWEEAYRRETAIVADLGRAVPRMAAGSALLLDGECPYLGPAVVFESDWDLRGVVRLMHQDRSLDANIVTPHLEVGDRAVTTWLTTPDQVAVYPYANGLVVYNRAFDVVVPIRSAGEMSAYLARYNPDRGASCPFGWSGNGVTILPRPL